jgi:hypothetical protein
VAKRRAFIDVAFRECLVAALPGHLRQIARP